ncbi:diguanylate cyclase [Chitinibacteraceae bacterium HSL-7]
MSASDAMYAPLVDVALPEAEESDALALRLEHLGYRTRRFHRLSALLAAEHSEPADAVVIGRSGLEGRPAVDWLAMLRKVLNGPILCSNPQLPLRELLALQRAGVTGFLAEPLRARDVDEQLEPLWSERSDEHCRVLVIDDSRMVLDWVTQALEHAGMRVCAVSDPVELFLQLDRFSPDLVLLDVYMPNYGGDELARLIRQDKRYKGVPLVFLSTETSRSRQFAARQMGGDDFLVKNIPAEELVAEVTITIERYRRLRYLMERDSLTGLLNHTTLTEQLERHIEYAHGHQTALSFAMIDIDHFKRINDTHGHAIGDTVIRGMARLLRQMVPNADLAARYGGEEFAVILPGKGVLPAARFVDALRERFATLIFHDRDGGTFHATCSGGLAELASRQRTASLIDSADQALYQAKAAGRNQVALHRPQTDS